MQTRVVVVALEAREREASRQGGRERRELVRDELVGEGVGLGRHAHGDVVALGEEHLGEQVGHGLAHARPRLDGAVRGGGERLGHLAGHGNLLGAALHALVHPRDHPAGLEGGLDLLGRDAPRRVQLGGVGALRSLAGAHQFGTDRLEREGRAPVLLAEVGKVGEDRPERPVDLGVHPREAAEQARGEVGEGAEQDRPHAAERLDVVTGAVRHRGAAEGGGHVGEAVRREPRKGYAGEREGVYPRVGDLRPARDPLDEGPVERRVVGEHRPPADELREGGNGVTGARSVADVGVGYARELGDLGRDGPAGVHEGLEALPDLAAAEQRRGDLYEVAVLK